MMNEIIRTAIEAIVFIGFPALLVAGMNYSIKKGKEESMTIAEYCFRDQRD